LFYCSLNNAPVGAARRKEKRKGDSAMPASTDNYSLLTTINLPGDIGGHGDWVTYDADTATIWIAQSPDNNVVVIDAKTNTIKAVIPNIGNANGIALTPQYAFVADVTNNTVDVIDKRTFAVVGQVHQTGTTPDSVVYVPSTNQVLVASDDNNVEDFINATAPFTQTRSLTLQPNPSIAGPDFAVYVPEKDLVYQPVDNVVDVIDPHTGTIVKTWTLLSSGSVKPMVYDPKTNRFIVGTTNNQLLVVDADSGSVLKTIAISGSVDEGSIDVAGRRAFFGDKAGVADIVNLDSEQLVGGLPAEKNMHTLAVDPTTHEVYVYENNRNTVDVYARPVANNDIVRLAATQNAVTGNVLSNDFDPDGDTLKVTSVSDFLNGVQQQVAVPASGTVTLQSNHGAFTIAADGSYTFTANDARPVQNHYAEDPLTYTISDGHGAAASAQLDINFVGQQRPSTETFNFNFVNATVTYDSEGQAYLTGPDGVTHNVSGVSTLIFNDGRINENNPTSNLLGSLLLGPNGGTLVDDLYYDSQYHDVYLAGIAPEQHYAINGWHEGRNPNPYFNTNYYLSQNHDVAATGVDPLSHYDTNGWHEGRNPGPNFNTVDYELSNPDVAAAHLDPLAHYLRSGELENRVIFPANAGTDGPVNGFDPTYYLAHNPDVAAAHVNPLQHYLAYGWHEGRNPSADFNTNYYETHNPDVAAAGVDPLIHYDQSGWHEGRDPSAVFSTSGYLTTYTDVAAAGVNPLQHFLQFGMAEGRNPMG
jgi:VCBS repeat-containing protein